MFYKGIIKNIEGAVFIAETTKNLANQMNITEPTIYRGLNGLKSPRYEFSVISKEEFLRIKNEQKIQKTAKLCKNISIRHDTNVLAIAKHLLFKRMQEIKHIKELYKDDEQKMKIEIGKAKVLLHTIKFNGYTMQWCRLNNNYKKI